MAETLEIVVRTKDEASSKFLEIGNVISGAVGGLAVGLVDAGLDLVAGAIGTAWEGLAGGIRLAIDEAMEAEANLAQLQAVLESTGGVAGVTEEMALGLADALSQVTRFSDDSILSAENLLLTFTNIGEDVFPTALETVLNMSTALGQDLQGSATQLGKALQDPILGVTALRRVGVNFNETQMEMIEKMVESGDVMGAQTLILQELETEFGNSARAAGETFAGKLDILRNRFLNLAESIGGKLIPIGTQLLETLGPTIDSLATKFAEFLESEEFTAWLESVIVWMRDDLPVVIANAADYWENTLQPALEDVGEVMKTVGGFLNDYVIPPLKVIGDIMGVVLPPIMAAFVGGWELQIEIFDKMLTPLRTLKTNFEFLAEKIRELKEALANLELPDWLTPGSPTPLEMGVRGINDALNSLNAGGLDGFSSRIGFGGAVPAMAGAGGGGMGGVTVNVNAGMVLSFTDEAGLEDTLKPMVLRWVNGQ